MQTATVYQEDSKLYLETFLIDNETTKKGKKVNDKTLDSNVLASRKHPLTLYPRQLDGKWVWDHPVLETNSLTDNLEFQKKYQIGHEVRLKKVKDGLWNAVYEITDAGAKKLLSEHLGKTIPFYTSTGIIHSSKEDPLNIFDWRIIHNAIVSEPANGFVKAAAVDMCLGTEQTCQTILTASMAPNFTFCTASALENYLSSLSSTLGNFPHYTMSSENQTTEKVGTGSAVQYSQGFTNNNAATGMGSIPASLTPADPPDQFKAKDETKKQDTNEEKVDNEAIIKQLKAELKQLKSDNESKTNENKSVAERLISLERENSRNSRKNQVFAILQQYPEAFVNPKDGQVNQQEYSKTVLEWIDKGYDDKTIQEILEAKVIKVKSVLASKNTEHLKQVYSSLTTASTAEYQTTQMGNTTTEDSSLPIWEKVSDLTNAKIRLSAEKYQKMGGRY